MFELFERNDTVNNFHVKKKNPRVTYILTGID